MKLTQQKRILLKTASWAIITLLFQFVVLYLLTGGIGKSVGIALAMVGSKTLMFFIHEEFWTKLTARKD